MISWLLNKYHDWQFDKEFKEKRRVDENLTRLFMMCLVRPKITQALSQLVIKRGNLKVRKWTFDKTN